jgi:integrase
MRAKLTKRTVDALAPETVRRYVYDTELPGFGVAVQPSGGRSFFVQYRTSGGRRGTARRVAIGTYGVVTVDQARAEARRLLGRVAHGDDPAAARASHKLVPTVREMGSDFLDHVRAHRKVTTAREHARRWERHVLPCLGSHRVSEVQPAQVGALHRKLRQTPYEANRVRALLGAFFSYAERQGARVRGMNPANEVDDYPEQARERFLTPEEVTRLGTALTTAERSGLPPAPGRRRKPAKGPKKKHRPKSADTPRRADPVAVAAIRFLLLTGWREREALTLRWSDVNLERGVAVLADSKTGRSVRRLGAPARALLAEMPRVKGCSYVFPGRSLDTPRVEINRVWYAVRHNAALEDVRLHDLRHSFASAAASGGGSLLVIGALLGHAVASTTQRYAHLLDDPVTATADAASTQLAAWLAGAAGSHASQGLPSERGAQDGPLTRSDSTTGGHARRRIASR